MREYPVWASLMELDQTADARHGSSGRFLLKWLLFINPYNLF